MKAGHDVLDTMRATTVLLFSDVNNVVLGASETLFQTLGQ